MKLNKEYTAKLNRLDAIIEDTPSEQLQALMLGVIFRQTLELQQQLDDLENRMDDLRHTAGAL